MAHELRCMYIYLTELCNLRCTHCWQSAPAAMQGHFPYLRFEECREFLDQACELGLRSVTLSGGEPLLSPDFPQFAEYFSSRRVSCALETNGMLISGQKLDAIARFNVFCAISLDGRRAETHNRQRGSQHAFDRTLSGMRRLEQARIKYQLIMSVCKLNYPELVPLLDWVRDEWPSCNSFKINVISPLGRALDLAGRQLLFSGTELTEIAKHAGGLKETYPFQLMLHINPAFFSIKDLKRGVCCGGRCGFDSGLSILSNGDVSICSMGKHVPAYVFGRVSGMDVREVWQSHSLLRAIHEEGYKRLTGVCSQCVLKRVCYGGCRAQSLLEYGDIFAPAPQCQAYFDQGLFPESRLIRTSAG